jgi:hypothetical protein
MDSFALVDVPLHGQWWAHDNVLSAPHLYIKLDRGPEAGQREGEHLSAGRGNCGRDVAP